LSSHQNSSLFCSFFFQVHVVIWLFLIVDWMFSICFCLVCVGRCCRGLELNITIFTIVYWTHTEQPTKPNKIQQPHFIILQLTLIACPKRRNPLEYLLIDNLIFQQDIFSTVLTINKKVPCLRTNDDRLNYYQFLEHLVGWSVEAMVFKNSASPFSCYCLLIQFIL